MARGLQGIGANIAAIRKRRGQSQEQLAGLLGFSKSWLEKIEQGQRPFDSIELLLRIARELRVPVADILAGAEFNELEEKDHLAAIRLRLTLSGHEVLAAMFSQELPVGTVSVNEMRAAVDEAWVLVHGSRFVRLGELLPGLISQGEVAVRDPSATDRARRHGLLAEVYQVTAAAMAKLGSTDAAWIAAERAVIAAEQAGDPLLAAAGDFRLAHAFLQGQRPDQAERTVQLALDAMAPRAADDLAPEVQSLWGALNLAAAVICARLREVDRALGHLDTARVASGRMGEDRNDFHTEFGPTNVALHEVAVAVELGKAEAALERAASVQSEHLSPERRGRFLINVARAHWQRRNRDEALVALEQARGVTPEQLRTNATVRELVREMVRVQRQDLDRDLVRMAQFVGVVR